MKRLRAGAPVSAAALITAALIAAGLVTPGRAQQSQASPAPDMTRQSGQQPSVPQAQQPAQPQTAQDAPPAANPADVASIEAIVGALYDVISGPAGKARDWNRLRSLFMPGARLIPTGRRPTGEYGGRALTVEEYIQRAAPVMEKEGFFERGIANRVEQFGQIAHVFSTYEARRKAEEAKPFLRGINSIQLLNDGKRWWVVTVFWQAEDDKTPLPEKYLKGEKD